MQINVRDLIFHSGQNQKEWEKEFWTFSDINVIRSIELIRIMEKTQFSFKMWLQWIVAMAKIKKKTSSIAGTMLA